jgi:putative ABC transport system permease protein
VAPRFLQVWGISPALGRDFAPDEQHFGGPTGVMISERLWRRRFNAAPDAIGKKLRFGTYFCTVIAILPASFLFPDATLTSGLRKMSASAK